MSGRDKDRRVLTNVITAAVREFAHNGTTASETRLWTRRICNLIRQYIIDGYRVNLPGVGEIKACAVGSQTVKSNLPNLKGNVFMTNPKSRVIFKPAEGLKRIARDGGMVIQPDVLFRTEDGVCSYGELRRSGDF